MEDNGLIKRAHFLAGSKPPLKCNQWEAKMLILNTFTECATTLSEQTIGPKPMLPILWWEVPKWEPIILFSPMVLKTPGNGPPLPQIKVICKPMLLTVLTVPTVLTYLHPHLLYHPKLQKSKIKFFNISLTGLTNIGKNRLLFQNQLKHRNNPITKNFSLWLNSD
jgi:hypothetical protein